MLNNINNLPDFQNTTILTKNALKTRSYFIPAADEKEFFANGNMRECQIASRYMSLSGEWLFAYYNNLSKVPKNAVSDINGKWEKIQVPSCWQSLGYEKPFYVNNDFTCPAVPPLVPNDNPVGVYKKIFTLSNAFKSKRIIITFLGVCSSFHVYLNGKEIGYAQGSHNMHEFELTPYLTNGENDLTVLVYKWCDGSYLESQDMFRYNGIFRDVYLTAVEDKSIFDFSFKTTHTSDSNFTCNLTADIVGDAEILLKLYNKNRETVYQGKTKDGKVTFNVYDVDLWTAETPDCYTLILELFDGDSVIECVGHTVGFKYIDYSDSVFKLNGKPIKLRGVNHHDTDAENGYAVSLDCLKKDVDLMKQFNVNTVRTSHYPPDPRLLQLCAEKGLYVINEADLESYGSLNMYEQIDYFGNSDDFTAAFIDRVDHLFQRDKNAVSVIMLSLGNEAGTGKNFDVSYEYLKKLTELPIQYETCFRGYEFGCGKKVGYDVVSIMYPDFTALENWMQEKDNRPVYMCEFAHAMGVGPGSLKEYMEYIYKNDKLFGGCIWEWQDHAVKHNGGVEYTYGGDHGEYIHDGNFCCDGLIYPDKTPSRSAYEMKNAYRPVIAELVSYEKNRATVSLFNTLNFISLSGYEICLSLNLNGRGIYKDKIVSSLEPFSKEMVIITLPEIKEKGEAVLSLEYVKDGKSFGFDDLILSDTYEITKPTGKISLPIESEDEIVFSTDGKVLVFDKNKCTFVSMRKNGVEYLNQNPLNRGYNEYADATRGFFANIWYAPIDNMLYYKKNWYDNLYNLMFISFYSCENHVYDDRAEIVVKGLFSPPKYSKKFEIEHKYVVYPDLSVEINSKLICCQENLPFLPRFGVQFEMPEEFNEVIWYGNGFGESYPDFNLGVKKGIYKANVNSLTENYVKPQGAASRSKVKWFEIADGNGNRLRIDCKNIDLAFSCQHFITESSEKSRHREDVVHMPTTEVSVDGFMSGIGSNSCGILPLEQYIVQPKKDEILEFSFIIKML